MDDNLHDLHTVLSDISAAARSEADGTHLAELAGTQRKVEYIEITAVQNNFGNGNRALMELGRNRP